MSGVARVVVLCSALACLAACSSGEEESGQYLVEASDLGAGAQRLRVSRDGKGVTDARVTVNGALAAHESDGTYVVSQPAAMPTGSRVDLLIVAGADTVQGQAVVAAAPSVTSPAANSTVLHTDDVAVEWSYAGSVDGFAVVTTAGTSVKTFAAAATDRRFVVASRELPSDAAVEVEVLAVTRGVLAGPVAAGSTFSVRSEATNATAFRRTPPVQVLGSVMSWKWQNVYLMAGNDVVEDAVITINGQAAPYSGSSGKYATDLLEDVRVGEELRLEVMRGSAWIGVATGLVPETPSVTAPESGTSYATTAPITVTWTSATNPDRFAVHAGWSCGESCGTGKDFDVAGTARTFDIPAGELPANLDLRLTVSAYSNGTFVGAFTSDSRMNIRSMGVGARTVRITSN